MKHPNSFVTEFLFDPESRTDYEAGRRAGYREGYMAASGSQYARDDESFMAGFDEGRAQRQDDALNLGFDQGRDVGFDQGQAEGFRDGHLIGRLDREEELLADNHELLKEAYQRTVRGQFQYRRKKIYDELVARDGENCCLCGGRSDLCIDHDIPVSQGGTNDVNNLMILCRSCNSRKGGWPFIRRL